MQDPFYHKEKRRKKTRMLAADAWLDSAMYEFGQSLGRGYTRVEDFFSRFRISGIKRLFVEIVSDGFSFLAIGMVLMTALALPAFDATATGRFNKAEDFAVTFLDRYGNEIGRRGIRSDDSYPLDKLPDYFVKAALATEDRRFYDHWGIDPIGTLRALMSNAQGENSTQGGSSITQQLAKNLFLSSERTLERKIKEAFLAVWLEWHYSKDEILKLYFDRAYMGGGNFGAAAAAEFYFGKKITDVNLAEAAMLAGLFKAPTKYAPHVDLAAARGRANLVLSNLVDAGFLTEGQVTAARRNPATPIDRSAEANSPNYFLDYAFEEAKKIIEASGTTSNTFVVRTTIDPVLQSYAEDSVTSVVREQGEAYNVSQAAMVVLEPTGPIRAMVGGVDYGKSQFNRSIVPNRQPGSAFKLFDYGAAFENIPEYDPDTRGFGRHPVHRQLVPAELLAQCGRPHQPDLGLPAVDQHRAGEPVDQDGPPADRRLRAQDRHHQRFPGHPFAGARCGFGQRHRHGVVLCGVRQPGLQDAGLRHYPHHDPVGRADLRCRSRGTPGARGQRPDREIHESDDARRGRKRHRPPGADRGRPVGGQDRHHVIVPRCLVLRFHRQLCGGRLVRQ